MSKIRLDALDDSQYDVLKEIGNIGAGNATTALACMLNQKIDMGVPKVNLVPFDRITDVFGSEETILAGILLGLEGDVNGMMMFLLPESAAHNIVNTVMGTPDNTQCNFSVMEMSALSEVGNIIAGSYLSALSALTGLTITASIPYTSIDMAGALLSLPAIEYGKIGDKVLLIETQFGEEVLGNGYFVMIPELESYEKILTSLGL